MKQLFLILLTSAVACSSPSSKEGDASTPRAAPEESPADPTLQFTHHYVDSDEKRPFKPTYLGVSSWQNPTDMWLMQELITEVKPDLIIETGTQHGGSALYYANVLEHVNPDGRVVTIDIENQAPKAREHPLAERIEFIVSDSVDPELGERLARRSAGKTVLVTLDSLHGDLHVSRELELYAPLVSSGSYLVVQDTIIDTREDWIEKYAKWPEGSTAGPALAVERFLGEHPEFVDSEADHRYLFSFHPGGYLRRK